MSSIIGYLGYQIISDLVNKIKISVLICIQQVKKFDLLTNQIYVNCYIIIINVILLLMESMYVYAKIKTVYLKIS